MSESKWKEMNYLRWFKSNADFGPADEDVHTILDEQYEEETGYMVPKEYRNDE